MLKSSVVGNAELDASDKAILNVLQLSGRISNVDLAEQVHLSPPATHARVKRMEADGVIAGYKAKINREKTGHDCMCFISVSLELHQTEKQQLFFKKVKALPQVLECHHLTGESDYLLKVLIRNNREMEDFITHTLLPIPGLQRVRTSVVLREIKSDAALLIE